MFVAFDYPMTVTTIGRRGASTVPSQALILMNNEFVVRQAERWADAAGKHPPGPRRVQAMYETAFGRPAEQREIARCLRFVEAQGKQYAGADAPFRAWADLAHALFNTKEFLFIP
jgi:hypothetical protein